MVYRFDRERYQRLVRETDDPNFTKQISSILSSAAQNIQLLPSSLSRSGMMLSSYFSLHIWLVKRTVCRGANT